MGDSNNYTLKRGNCGLSFNLKHREDTDIQFLKIKSDTSLLRNFKHRNPKGITLSNIPEKSRHVVQTQKMQTKCTQMKHIEGGWPKTIDDISDVKETNIWKRHRENHDEKDTFAPKVKHLIASTLSIINQNLRMDIYEDYFDGEDEKTEDDEFSAKTKTVFKDTIPYKRTVNKVAWSTDEEQSKIAVTYKLCKGQTLPPGYKLPCLVWNIENPSAPCNVITYSSEIVICSFNNTKNTNYLGCGCANGNLFIYDINTHKVIAQNKIEDAHSEAITDFIWLKTRSGTEFVTTSTDGKTVWWDMKNGNIECEFALRLIDPFDTENQKLHCGLRIEYNSDTGSKFLISTEQGIAFQVNKKKNDAEIISKFSNNMGKHLGPISGIQRCPNNTKYFVTVGDWTIRFWADDFQKSPFIISKYNPANITDCMWSLARSGLLFVSRSDGWIMAYDLCYKINEHAFLYKVSDSSINTIALNLKGDKIIAGDEEGKVYLIKLSKSFYNTHNNEVKKEYIGKLFERESTREKYLEVKKKPVKDDSGKQQKLEQQIKEKVAKIEEEYYPYISKILEKTHYEGREEIKQITKKDVRMGIAESEKKVDTLNMSMASKEKEDVNVSNVRKEEGENEKKEEYEIEKKEEYENEKKEDNEAEIREEADSNEINNSEPEKKEEDFDTYNPNEISKRSENKNATNLSKVSDRNNLNNSQIVNENESAVKNEEAVNESNIKEDTPDANQEKSNEDA